MMITVVVMLRECKCSLCSVVCCKPDTEQRESKYVPLFHYILEYAAVSVRGKRFLLVLHNILNIIFIFTISIENEKLKIIDKSDVKI